MSDYELEIFKAGIAAQTQAVKDNTTVLQEIREELRRQNTKSDSVGKKLEEVATNIKVQWAIIGCGLVPVLLLAVKGLIK